MNDLIVLRDIVKSYQQTNVLKQLSLKVKCGEFVSVLGESGSGKSTLMNIIGLLDTFDSGEYMFNGKTINNKQQAHFRNSHIGFIFQMYYLLPSLSVYQNIMVPLLYSKGIRKSQTRDVSEELGLGHLLTKKADTLSGGEKQRVAIARALLLNPDLLIADEPTGALDEKNSFMVLETFKEYTRIGKSVIMVTHNKTYAAFADNQYLLSEGRLVAA